MAGWQPTWQLLVAFSNLAQDDPALITTVASPPGTLGAVNVWTDITADVRTNLDTNRGRQHEIDHVQAGTMSLTLDNRSGRYDTWNLSSPYTGKVLPGTPVRLQATFGGVTKTVFTGVTDVWATGWAAPAYATVAVSCVDMFAYLNNAPLIDIAAHTYTAAITADGAAHLWRLNEPPGATTAADSIGAKNATSRDLPTFGIPGFLNSTATAVQLGTPTATAGWLWANAFVNLGADFTIEAWVQHTAVPAARSYIYLQADVTIDISVWVDTDGKPGFTWTFDTKGTTNICDGNWHHIVVTNKFGTTTTTIYVDGVAQNTGSSGSAFADSYMLIGASSHATEGGYGNVADLALYPSLLSAGTVAAHTALAAIPAETSGARVARIATALGIPAGTIETGNSQVQAVTATTAQTSALSYLQTVEQTEAGLLYMDTSGHLNFRARGTIYTSTASTVTFGDGGGEIPFELGPQIAVDTQDVYEQIVLQRTNGNPQTAGAQTGQYGARTYNQSGLLNTTDREVKNYAAWLLAQFAAPKPRIRQITVHPLVDPSGGTATTALLALEIGAVVTVNRHTLPGGGTAFSQVCNVEGINFHIYPDSGDWNVDLQLTPLPPERPWILGTSTLNTDTNLFF